LVLPPDFTEPFQRQRGDSLPPGEEPISSS
jgi:hypothetical protein